MKKLNLPPVDDVACTTALSENRGLIGTSYPYVKNELTDLLAGYSLYSHYRGSALKIDPLGLTGKLKSGLSSNYKSPPKELRYITEIRESSPNICPMCGSLKSFSVDHYLPQDDYAEFAIYSRNLVPACDCNSKRGKQLMDKATSSRVLHPYFDDCLKDRQLSCDISPDPIFPRASINIAYVNPTHPLAASIKFHTEKIVLRSGVINDLIGRWASAVDCPMVVIQTLPPSLIASVGDMESAIQDCLSRHDKRLDTPNNWESIFVHGLLQSVDAMEWLMDKHNEEYL